MPYRTASKSSDKKTKAAPQTSNKASTKAASRAARQTHVDKKGRLTAKTADRYELYRLSVQDPAHEVKMFTRLYKDARKKLPTVLREDFCGTFAVCCEWVKSDASRRAIGIDLDPEPLAWGRAHHLTQLADDERERVTLVQADVRTATTAPADVVAAQNFSFFLFKTRDELRGYFESAHAGLADDGVFICDMVGGSAMFDDEQEESRHVKGFRYVWEQARFDPITHDATFYIHFRFQDGTEMRRAFAYEWRLWTLPEVRELLVEAGFREVFVYWETTDKDGDGTGVYRRRTQATPQPAWLCYLVAVK